MEEINKAYATFQERDRIASSVGAWKRLKSNTKTER